MADIRDPKFWTNLFKKVVKSLLKEIGVRTNPPTHNQHVVPHPEGWAVKGEGNEKYTAIYKYQDEAIERVREILSLEPPQKIHSHRYEERPPAGSG